MRTFMTLSIAGLVKERFPEFDATEDSAVVPASKNTTLLEFLKDHKELEFTYLVELTAVDYKGYIEKAPERFAVVYILYSFKLNSYYKVKAYVPESSPEIASVTHLWKAANWAEREVFDMFGIKFSGHPDLKRILLPETFKDYPLRKEYPLKGKGERQGFEPYYLPRKT